MPVTSGLCTHPTDNHSRPPVGSKQTFKRTYGWRGETHDICEGPDTMNAKLASSEGHQVTLKREHMLVSATIKVWTRTVR